MDHTFRASTTKDISERRVGRGEVSAAFVKHPECRPAPGAMAALRWGSTTIQCCGLGILAVDHFGTRLVLAEAIAVARLGQPVTALRHLFQPAGKVGLWLDCEFGVEYRIAYEWGFDGTGMPDKDDIGFAESQTQRCALGYADGLRDCKEVFGD